MIYSFTVPLDVRSSYRSEMVEIQPGIHINTVIVPSASAKEVDPRENGLATPTPTSQRLPLVMVHGFGGGLGLFAKNFDSLSEKRKLYAFDLLGFGRSSRIRFSSDADLAEQQFVDAIESWRKKMGLEKFILVGHSMGGYLACSYAIKHPQNVRHLVLADPWGFVAQTPEEAESLRNLPLYARGLIGVFSRINPISVVRASGPIGKYTLIIQVIIKPQVIFLKHHKEGKHERKNAGN